MGTHAPERTVRSGTTSVVVVTHDTCDEVLGCLRTLAADAVDEIVVVDSGSCDGTAAAVRALAPDVRLLELHNVGFARAANAGLRACASEVSVVCNADVRFEPGAVTRLAEAVREDARIGAVGPLVRYPDGAVQASARRSPDLRTAIVHAALGRLVPDNPATRRYHDRDVPTDAARDVDWLSGCTIALRREAIESVGGFDPGYFLYVEDVDLSQRLRSAGWSLRFDPRAEVVHRVGASTSRHRLRCLVEHARSLDRYVRGRASGAPAGIAAFALRPALAGWVLVTYLAERLSRGARSTTGERTC